MLKIGFYDKDLKSRNALSNQTGLLTFLSLAHFLQRQSAICIWPPDDYDFSNSNVQLCYK